MRAGARSSTASMNRSRTPGRRRGGHGDGRRWARTAPFGVCDREALGALVAGDALVVAEEGALTGPLPEGVAFAAADVQAERLIVGQELLDEPGEIPQGSRLTPWLLQVLGVSRPAGEAPGRSSPAAGGGAAATGYPAPGSGEAHLRAVSRRRHPHHEDEGSLGRGLGAARQRRGALASHGGVHQRDAGGRHVRGG